MEKIKAIKQDRPILFSVVLSALFLAMMHGIGPVIRLFNITNGMVKSCVAQWMVGLIMVIVTWVLGDMPLLKKRGIGFFKGLLSGGYFLVIVIFLTVITLSELIVNPNANLSAGGVILCTLYMLGVGVTEEVLCRGIIFNALWNKWKVHPHGIWLTVVVSSVLFGLLHLSNLLSDGADTVAVLEQVVSAIFLGMLIGAIYMRCGNLWVVIFLHAFNDFPSVLGSFLVTGADGGSSVISVVSLVAQFILYAVPVFWILRSKHRKELIAPGELRVDGQTTMG